MLLFSDGLQSINNNNRRKRIVKNAYIPSRGIRKIPHLSTLLPEFHICKDGKGAEAVVGWGLRPTTHKARAFAAEHRLPFIALEDGFLRSLGLGVAGYPPYSIVYDDIGIYYDTTRPSRLEQLILAADTMPSETLAQAQQAMDFILRHHLSKYNHAPELSDDHPLRSPSKPETVLIIDQTFGDMAIQYGGADASTFELMFQTALMLRCGIICLFGWVFERAQGIEDGGGFFRDEAVFDDAVVAREIDDAFGAQACGEEPSACASSVMLRSPSSSRKRMAMRSGLAISLRMVDRRLISMFLFLLLYERLMLVKLR